MLWEEHFLDIGLRAFSTHGGRIVNRVTKKPNSSTLRTQRQVVAVGLGCDAADTLTRLRCVINVAKREARQQLKGGG